MIGLHVFQRPTGELETTACAQSERRTVPFGQWNARSYVPYETNETGGTVSRAFLDLAGNQLLKRGGYVLMGHMAGTDPLFRLHWSTFSVAWLSTSDRKGNKSAHPDVGPQIKLDKGKHAHTKEIFWVVSMSTSDRSICRNAYQTYSQVHPKHPGKRPSQHHHW